MTDERLRAYDDITTRIWRDKRATPGTRELLLALAWIVERDPDAAATPRRERGRYLWQQVHTMTGNDELGRPRYKQLVADDAPSGHDVLIAGTDGPKLRLRSLRVVTEHAYATGAPCDGETCEAGGAAHCHRCAEVEADKLLAERDRLREGWRRACALLADAGWDGDERWETIRAEVEEPHAAPDPLNLPAYAWGESVTWNQGRVLVPLNRDNETVADLVLDEEAAGMLAAMLDDAAGASDPTDWGEPGIQWTCGVRRPDGSTTTDTDAPPADDETAVRAYVDAMQDSNGYRKALLRRDVSAWREVADA